MSWLLKPRPESRGNDCHDFQVLKLTKSGYQEYRMIAVNILINLQLEINNL